MKLIKIIYVLFLLLAGWQTTVLAQVDSTSVDSVALDSTATDTLFLYTPELPSVAADTVSFDTTVTDTLFLFPMDVASFQDRSDQLAAQKEKKELLR